MALGKSQSMRKPANDLGAGLYQTLISTIDPCLEKADTRQLIDSCLEDNLSKKLRGFAKRQIASWLVQFRRKSKAIPCADEKFIERVIGDSGYIPTCVALDGGGPTYLLKFEAVNSKKGLRYIVADLVLY